MLYFWSIYIFSRLYTFNTESEKKKKLSYPAHFCNLAFVLILWTPFHVSEHCFVSILVSKDYSIVYMYHNLFNKSSTVEV